jgi:Spy/CpxP family protein refolding chaperone
MRSGLVMTTMLAMAVVLPPVFARAESPPPQPARPAASHHAPGVNGAGPEMGIDDEEELRQGAGMGQARVAELHGYPGPRHVLGAWRAGELPLRGEQSARIEAIREAMAREAHRLGAQVLDAERALADAFRSGRIDAPTLQADVDRIAALRGALRAVHLRAHLETRAVLDPDQLARYAELRDRAPGDTTPGPRP